MSDTLQPKPFSRRRAYHNLHATSSTKFIPVRLIDAIRPGIVRTGSDDRKASIHFVVLTGERCGHKQADTQSFLTPISCQSSHKGDSSVSLALAVMKMRSKTAVVGKANSQVKTRGKCMRPSSGLGLFSSCIQENLFIRVPFSCSQPLAP